MVADSYSIVAWWRKYFSQLLNVHGINDVRQTEIHATEPSVFEPSAFELEMVVEKLKKKNTHRQVLIKSLEKWLKKGAE